MIDAQTARLVAAVATALHHELNIEKPQGRVLSDLYLYVQGHLREIGGLESVSERDTESLALALYFGWISEVEMASLEILPLIKASVQRLSRDVRVHGALRRARTRQRRSADQGKKN